MTIRTFRCGCGALCALWVLGSAGCQRSGHGAGDAPGGGGAATPRPRPEPAAVDPRRPADGTGGAPALAENAAKRKAEALTAQLAKGAFSEVLRSCTDRVQKALPEARLKGLWERLQIQTGAYRSHRVQASGVAGPPGAPLRRVTVRVTFARATVDLLWSFGPDGKVAGLRLQSVRPVPVTWDPPPYAPPERVREVPVTVGAGPTALPGLLALPAAADPKKRLPAVVLVHGSGPQDRDETLGPNKVFKDIAWGLAAAGVAVLRYDKVTKAHPKAALQWLRSGKLTPDRETVDDALAAVALLRRHPRIRPDRIFYAGHSQGGYLGPWAARRDPKLAGLILLAAPTRPLEALVRAQIRYISGLGGARGKAAREMLPKLEKAVALVRSGRVTPQTPADALPLGVPAAFWLAVKDYRPAQVAARLTLPILVLQGEADYQVTVAEDFAGWKRALGNKKSARLKSYPGLGHHFIDLKKKMAVPEDYSTVRGHVAADVIRDIAEFVR